MKFKENCLARWMQWITLVEKDETLRVAIKGETETWEQSEVCDSRLLCVFAM